MSAVPIAVHGGPDAQGAVPWDFSTNVNPAGPCPAALQALQAVDATRYPDPAHQALREQLAAWHGVAPGRVLFAASASEFIQRITAVGQRLQPGPVSVPVPGYADYARAAAACGRALNEPGATLRWACEPGSPLGQGADPLPPADTATVLDAVYAPLRLEGESRWPAAARDAAFVLHSPNKALGLAGVRAAYAIAPAAARWRPWCEALDAALPSWPLGAHGVALLQAWASAPVQRWLAESREPLSAWKHALRAGFAERGIDTAPSVTPFFCARLSTDAAALRRHGIKVRDCHSFGMPGWVRLNALPPPAQAALWRGLSLVG